MHFQNGIIEKGDGRRRVVVTLRYIAVLCLTLSACNSAESGRTAVDPALAALMPPDATMLVGVRMDAIRNTPLYRKMLAQKQLPQLDDFARETGFDPRRDVREMLVGSNGKDALVAARGAFNPRAFEKLAKTNYQGYTLYARQQGGVALINSSITVAGNLPAVRAAIDRYKAGSRSGPTGLLARARQIPPSDQLWSVSNGFDSLLTSRIPDSGNTANVGRILRSLENTTAAADLASGVNGFIDGLCRSEQDAKNLGDAARGMVGLGRLSVPENQPEMLRLWDGIKVDQQQRTIKVTVAIPQDLLDKLIDLLGKQPQFRRLPVNAPIRPAAFSEAGSHLPESKSRPR